MDSIHTKLYVHNGKGQLKEIRRTNLPTSTDFAGLCVYFHQLTGMYDFQLEYKDHEDDMIVLNSQPEWEECCFLHANALASIPLRVHLKKKKSGKKEKKEEKVKTETPQPFLQPDHFYHSGPGMQTPVEQLQDIQSAVPKIVQRHLPANWESNPEPSLVPEWLQSAFKVCQERGETQLDVNIQNLAKGLEKQGLSLMEERNFTDAMQMLKDSDIVLPAAATKYNIACCFALAGDSQAALQALGASVESGYNNLQHMIADPDLLSLHFTEEFQSLAKKLQDMLVTPQQPTPTSPIEVLTRSPSVDVIPEDEVVPEVETPAEPLIVTEPVLVAGLYPDVSATEEATAPEPEPKFAQELTKLNSMGFFNNLELINILEGNNGSVVMTVEALLANM